jgi:hypothetical protein
MCNVVPYCGVYQRSEQKIISHPPLDGDVFWLLYNPYGVYFEYSSTPKIVRLTPLRCEVFETAHYNYTNFGFRLSD